MAYMKKGLHSANKKTEQSTTEEVEESSVLFCIKFVEKTLQQGQYSTVRQGCQQLKLEIGAGREITAEKDEFYRQVSAQHEEPDYSELYSAYSGMIRRSQVEPRILFEILVCAFTC